MCTGIFCHNRLSRYWNRFSLILDRNYFSILHWKDKSYFNIQNYPLKILFPRYPIILTERISYDKQQQDAGVNIEWFSLSDTFNSTVTLTCSRPHYREPTPPWRRWSKPQRPPWRWLSLSTGSDYNQGFIKACWATLLNSRWKISWRTETV